MINTEERLCTSTIQHKDNAWRFVYELSQWFTSVLMERDKGYYGGSRESDEDILGYWGRRILTLQTILWIPNPCELFHAKQWCLREVSSSFSSTPFLFSLLCAVSNLLVENKSTKNVHIANLNHHVRRFLSNNITQHNYDDKKYRTSYAHMLSSLNDWYMIMLTISEQQCQHRLHWYQTSLKPYKSKLILSKWEKK